MKLSNREKEILSLSRLDSKDIANRLNLSWTTVQSYFANLKIKYGANTRVELVLKVLKSGDFQISDMGFWDDNGIYQEDLQIIEVIK